MPSTEHPVSTIIRRAQHAAGRPTATSARFGSGTVRIFGDDEFSAPDTAARLAASESVTWVGCDVHLATPETVPVDALPPELRPRPGYSAKAEDNALMSYTSGYDGCAWFIDTSNRVAVRWSETGPSTAERVNPLRAMARWWSVANDAAMVHCAAVADDVGAVLLVGDAGAGKSTTSLSCLDTGLTVLGDDFCFVDRNDDRSFVAPMYRFGKLDEAALRLVPAAAERTAGRATRGKQLVDLGIGVERARPVVAVCHVVQDHVLAAPTLHPIRRSAAIAAAAPSTIGQVRMFESASFELLAAALLPAPCYQLTVGRLDGVPELLASLLDGHRRAGQR